MSKDPLEVTETHYLKAGDGPGEDTGAFYAGTPAPGSDRNFDAREPPSGRLAAATPLWVRRVARPTSASNANDTGGIPPMAFAAAAGFLVVALLGIMAVGLWWMTRPSDPVPEPVVEEVKEERYQGLKVKKGLQ